MVAVSAGDAPPVASDAPPPITATDAPPLTAADASPAAQYAVPAAPLPPPPLAGPAGIGVTILSVLAAEHSRAHPRGLLCFFSTRDARALRLVNAEFRDCVASYAWLDLATVVHRLAPWTASFPHARGINVGPKRELSDSDKALLRDVAVVVPLAGPTIEGDRKSVV